LADTPEVFLLDYGRFDILLPAGDFGELISGSELKDLPEYGCPACLLRGRETRLVWLDNFVSHLLPAVEAETSGLPTFFVVRERRTEEAVLATYRSFELLTFPLHELKLLPAGLRKRLGLLGLVAVRFSTADRLQYLLDVSSSGSTATGRDREKTA